MQDISLTDQPALFAGAVSLENRDGGVHPNGPGYELIGRRFAKLAFAPEGPFPTA